MKKEYILKKKCAFILLKGIFNKIGGAENMPVVAGCLVSSILVEICSKFILFNDDLTLLHGFNSTKAAAAKWMVFLSSDDSNFLLISSELLAYKICAFRRLRSSEFTFCSSSSWYSAFAHYFPPIFKIWKKNQSLETLKSVFNPIFPNWQCPMFYLIGHFMTVKFLSPSCCKFPVEFDSNSKISQNVQNLGFFKKNGWVFPKKLDFFPKSLKWQICCTMRINWLYFLKIFFHLNF